MICLFNLRLWTGFLCVLLFCFVWPVQGHETWHTVLFLIWFGYPCSWLWACLSATYTAYAKAHYLQHRLLGVRRSETGDCFVFVSWCQCFWLSAVHWLFELVFIFDCCQFKSLLCCVIWKPAVGVCSLCLPHVGILITAFSASLFTIQLAIIWVIWFVLTFCLWLA